MGKIGKRSQIMAIIGIVLWLGGGVVSCRQASTVIIVEGPTKVMPKPECSFHKGARESFVLQRGDKVQVVGVRYPKDCMVYQVKLSDGYVGYITNGDNFKIIEGQSVQR